MSRLTDEIVDLPRTQEEKESFGEMGIDFEEKAFYDILKTLAHKYDFEYPEDKLVSLAKPSKKSSMINPSTPTGANAPTSRPSSKSISSFS